MLVHALAIVIHRPALRLRMYGADRRVVCSIVQGLGLAMVALTAMLLVARVFAPGA